jgi:hypothetical protein
MAILRGMNLRHAALTMFARQVSPRRFFDLPVRANVAPEDRDEGDPFR